MNSSQGAQILALVRSKKAFLWDFDGCFCDTEPLHFEAYRQAFAQFGHKVDSQEYYRVFTHLGEGIAGECARYNINVDQDLLLNLKKEAYWKLISEKGRASLFAGMHKILIFLASNGSKIAIASNSPVEEIAQCLAQNTVPVKIDAIIGRTPNLRKKPAPDIFLAAMQRLEVQAHECLVFEDSERGLLAAAAAGCDALWLRTAQNQDLTTDAPHTAALTHDELVALTQGNLAGC